jgi:hypothetical protein
VVIGAVLVVASYTLHAAGAIRALITGRAEEVIAPTAATRL